MQMQQIREFGTHDASTIRNTCLHSVIQTATTHESYYKLLDASLDLNAANL